LRPSEKVCDCRSYFHKAPNARSTGVVRAARVVIDPVETGFLASGMSRETLVRDFGR
jgi:hypothetical protein